jgi:hypothetical protein
MCVWQDTWALPFYALAVSGVARPQGDGLRSCGRLLPLWAPHAVRLCCRLEVFATLCDLEFLIFIIV